MSPAFRETGAPLRMTNRRLQSMKLLGSHLANTCSRNGREDVSPHAGNSSPATRSRNSEETVGPACRYRYVKPETCYFIAAFAARYAAQRFFVAREIAALPAALSLRLDFFGFAGAATAPCPLTAAHRPR
jgi:hypothetical protein